MLFSKPIIFLTLCILAAPPAVKARSWKRFLINLPLCFFGIMVPLFFFVGSALLIPAWIGDAHHGWIDCFPMGKLALIPLVLWATGALYRVEVLKNPLWPRDRYALLTGSIISLVSLILGFTTVHDRSLEKWLLVPLYVFLWYLFRTIQQARNFTTSGVLKTLAVQTPFWGLSLYWSYRTYLSLPKDPPSCFVVTAASRGHRKFVGPFQEVTHRGQTRLANQQLITLWQFEALWRRTMPRTHAFFRRVYNFIGPIIARRINSPLKADLFYLILKPAEFIGWLLLIACIKIPILLRLVGRVTPCAPLCCNRPRRARSDAPYLTPLFVTRSRSCCASFSLHQTSTRETSL